MATTNTSAIVPPVATPMMILCCMCGITIPSNPSNMCLNCIRTQVDITEGLPTQLSLNFCRGCERYLQPPKFWVQCGLESRELLTLCLKKIRGLNKMKLVDASFIWTEPHSRRIKIKITVQKEVFNGTVVQQVLPVEFEVVNMQCEACAKSYTPHTWVAVAQIRQKVDHKRTFYFLEQLIIKHKAHENCVQIKDLPDGIDFFFMKRTHAQKFIDFVSQVAPIKNALSKRLISHDAKSNTFNYKYGLAAELTPICREDLVCLPKKVCTSMGSLGPVVICYRINAALHFLDPTTLQVGEIAGHLYWKSPFKSMLTARQLSKFTVLDVELLDTTFGKYRHAEAQIVRNDEIGTDGEVFFVKTHLGNILAPGDVVLGYDMTNANYNDENISRYRRSDLPDVVLVKKFFEKKASAASRRNWKLKNLVKEEDESMRRADARTQSEEYAKFLVELEEDEDMRAAINIYKDKKAIVAKKPEGEEGEESDNDSEMAGFGVRDEELLDDESSADEREAFAARQAALAEEDDEDDGEWEDADDADEDAGLAEGDKDAFPEDDEDDDEEGGDVDAPAPAAAKKPTASTTKTAAPAKKAAGGKQHQQQRVAVADVADDEDVDSDEEESSNKKGKRAKKGSIAAKGVVKGFNELKKTPVSAATKRDAKKSNKH